MANQEAIKKYQDELKSLKDTLTKYGDLFNADGNIDAEEQKQLNTMHDIIKKAEAKLAEMSKSGAPTAKGELAENEADNPKAREKDKATKYTDVTKQQLNQISNVFVKGGGDKGDVDWNDVQQGGLGDCYFMSAIGAVAKSDPAALKKLIKGPDKNGAYEVTLHIKEKGFFDFFSSRKPVVVTITSEFLVDASGNPIYAGKGDSELWVMLLEKAYAILRGKERPDKKESNGEGYEILTGGWGEEGIEVLTGKEADTLWIKDLSDEKIKSTISTALADKRPITTGTIMGPDKGKKADKKQMAAGALNIVLGHEYFVLDLKGDKLTLQNPWNDEQVDGDGRGDITISLADYKLYFRNICVQEK